MITPKMPLSTLQKVNLRDCWEHEAQAFTPWLATDENLQILSNAIGMPLEVVKQEAPVGPYSADILCRIPTTDHYVLIENQLEKTDHSHLGQLLTYAAGLEAITIIWIAAKFTDEHRAALDWLNRTTREGVDFFGIEIELWKIADSPAAPRFNIVANPNDWAKHIATVKKGSNAELSPTAKQNLAYWETFNQLVDTKASKINPVKPSKDNYQVYGIGNGKILLEAIVSFKDSWVGSRMSFTDKNIFHLLFNEKETIERAAGASFEWIEGSGRVVLKQQVTLADQDQWPEIQSWHLEAIEGMVEHFSPKVKALVANGGPSL